MAAADTVWRLILGDSQDVDRNRVSIWIADADDVDFLDPVAGRRDLSRAGKSRRAVRRLLNASQRDIVDVVKRGLLTLKEPPGNSDTNLVKPRSYIEELEFGTPELGGVGVDASEAESSSVSVE